MVNPKTVGQAEYRAFRARLLHGVEPDRKRGRRYAQEEPVHPLAKGRLLIEAFREKLVNRSEDMLKTNPDIEPMLRRALHIRDDLPLIPETDTRIAQFFMKALSCGWRIKRAQRLIQVSSTYHGRELIFQHYIKPTLCNIDSFSCSLDFILRKSLPFKSDDEIRHVTHANNHLVRACFALGASTATDIMHVVTKRYGNYLNEHLLRALVECRAIDSLNALIEIPGSESGFTPREPDNDDIRRFQAVVHLLMSAGVAPSSVRRLVSSILWRLDPDTLAATLGSLQMTGDELTRLFDVVGEQLLYSETDRWLFLRDILGIHTADEMGKFRRLLDQGRSLNRDFALALRHAGADTSILVAAQELILSIDNAGGAERPIAHLQLLRGNPYAFSLEQIVQAKSYLLAERELEPYLQLLVRYHYTEAKAILAFQTCYTSLDIHSLTQWLDVLGEKGEGIAPTEIAEWIALASKAGYLDSFRYLISVGFIGTFKHLQLATKLAPFGSALLRYLVEERHLNSIHALRELCLREKPGIREAAGWGELNPVARVLLADAYDRNDFTILKTNHQCIGEFIGKRIIACLGHFPFRADEAIRENYHRNADTLRQELNTQLAPRINSLLGDNDGFLLASLLDLIDEPETEIVRHATALRPLLNDLRTGGGPADTKLTALEKELIALVYRTDTKTVDTHWPRVTGQERDIANLVIQSGYPMHWKQTRKELVKLLDNRGFEALSVAAQFASQFLEYHSIDLSEACKYLSSKRLVHQAADVWSLAHHLGLLIAIADGNASTHDWKNKMDEIASRKKDDAVEYEHIEWLLKLFDVDLPDALNENLDDFIDRFDDQTAALLVGRVDQHANHSAAVGKDRLRQTLQLTKSTVLTHYSQWIKNQKDNFVDVPMDAHQQMTAVVSKSPAAFFAKHSVNICTRDNTAMWQEERNAHLLVFAPGEKRIVGMALLYFEKISRIDKDRRTLIIRAINPIEEMLSRFSVSSMVDAYVDVAIQIARDNDFAAVAFPEPNGMHLMSNLSAIEDYVKERHSISSRSITLPGVRSTPWSGDSISVKDELFYAYEKGVTPINRLYLLWECEQASEPILQVRTH